MLANGQTPRKHDSSKGFTFIETMLVMGFVSMLFFIASQTLFQSRQSASLDSTARQMINDVRQQQMYAMLGATSSAGLTRDYSVKFDATSYTLFPGDTYISGASNNLVIPIDDSLTLSDITFPSYMITFTRLSGDVAGFQSGLDSLIIRDTQTGATRELRLNKRGVFVEGL